MTEIYHEIVNDFAVDSIKDNFSPPKITEMREDVAEHLIEKLGLSFQLFFEDIKKNGEYLKDNGKVFFWTSDVAKFIRKELFGNSEQGTGGMGKELRSKIAEAEKRGE